ncbi:MAG: enoyl-ACP reductase [Anaerolineae bacterium]|nr:MAG: enoyl-ACP reductase [Anaerolineae bacterium]
MGLLGGKKGLIFGVANKHSIAWGIARALAAEGAELGFSYAFDKLERRVRPLAESLGATFIEPCNVNDDAQIEATFARAKEHFGALDILVHSIAFAEMEDLSHDYIETGRRGFLTAMETSVYSLVALARAAAALMRPGGSILTMTYYGGEKVVPGYNVVGVAKAALEASVRYLASELGPRGVRVNAISAGPIRTLSTAMIPGFRKMLRFYEQATPLRQSVTQEDVGQMAVFLASDMARNTTGQALFVDGGYNIMGLMGGTVEMAT